MIGAVKGYDVEIVMSEKVSIERRKMIKAFGASVTLTDENFVTVYANLEHSFWGDLEIWLECPNGQIAYLTYHLFTKNQAQYSSLVPILGTKRRYFGNGFFSIF